MVTYRRRSNWVGWLAFFAIGACVFVGLVILLQVGKKYQAKEDDKQAKNAAEQQAKLLDPRQNIWNEVAKQYREQGVGYKKRGMNLAEKVTSSKAADKVYYVGRVRHSPAPKTEDDDPPITDEVYIVEIAGKTLKFTRVSWDNWEKARDQFGFDESVTKSLEGPPSGG
jgi:hypothetical protein